MKSPPTDLLWGLSWTQGWAWGLNLWSMSSVVTSCLRQSMRNWALECQQVFKAADSLFLSFSQFYKSLIALCGVPQSLSLSLWAARLDSQQHLEQGKKPCSPLCCSLGELRHPEDKSPFSQGSGGAKAPHGTGVWPACPGSLQGSEELLALLYHLKLVLSLFICWFCCFRPFCNILHSGSGYLPALEMWVVWDVKQGFSVEAEPQLRAGSPHHPAQTWLLLKAEQFRALGTQHVVGPLNPLHLPFHLRKNLMKMLPLFKKIKFLTKFNSKGKNRGGIDRYCR